MAAAVPEPVPESLEQLPESHELAPGRLSLVGEPGASAAGGREVATSALFLRSLPVRAPQQLVAISTISPDGQNGKDPLSLPMFEEIRQRQQVFSGMFAWSGGGMSNFEANGVKYAAGLDTVSGDYYSTLGIQPFLGRLITQNDVASQTGSSAR